jgi:hypothetical protein
MKMQKRFSFSASFFDTWPVRAEKAGVMMFMGNEVTVKGKE